MPTVVARSPLALVAFPAVLLRVRVALLDGRTASPRTPAAAWSHGDAALLNGPMFALCPGTPAAPTEAARYRGAVCERLVYGLYVRDGFRVDSLEPHAGATLAVVRGVASMHAGWSAPPDADVAVQGYPPLVREGVSVASNVGSNAEATHRVAVGILHDGRVGFAVMATDLETFAHALREHGAEWVYTDGGGSAYLGLAGQRLAGSTEGRPVPVWLACAGHEGGDGPGGVLAGAAVGALVGGAVAGPPGAAVGALLGALVGGR